MNIMTPCTPNLEWKIGPLPFWTPYRAWRSCLCNVSIPEKSNPLLSINHRPHRQSEKQLEHKIFKYSADHFLLQKNSEPPKVVTSNFQFILNSFSVRRKQVLIHVQYVLLPTSQIVHLYPWIEQNVTFGFNQISVHSYTFVEKK